MTTMEISGYLKLPLRSEAEARRDIERRRNAVTKLDDDDRFAISHGAQEFVATLYDPGRPFDSKRIWLRAFFAHLRRRMLENGRCLERALEAVDYDDLPMERDLLDTEARLDYRHGLYCRAMIRNGGLR